MKRFVSSALVAIAAAAAGSAHAQVGVSIGINEPGVYGRINIGEPPPPVALVAPQPVYIARPRVGVPPPPPVYLYVPLAQQRDWRRYCGRYDACGRPVYFVRDDWVRERYVHEHPDWRGRPAAGRPVPPPRVEGPRHDGRGDGGPRRDGYDRHDDGRRGPGGSGRD